MNKEQVRRAILNTLTDWCEEPLSRKVQDAMIVRILKLDRPLDRPPTVTRKELRYAIAEGFYRHDDEDDFSGARALGGICDYLTAQGVNVEDE